MSCTNYNSYVIIKEKKNTGKTNMTKTEAWNYALGMIKIDGLRPTKDFKKYIKLEKSGKATTKDIKRYLDKRYMAK